MGKFKIEDYIFPFVSVNSLKLRQRTDKKGTVQKIFEALLQICKVVLLDNTDYCQPVQIKF